MSLLNTHLSPHPNHILTFKHEEFKQKTLQTNTSYFLDKISQMAYAILLPLNLVFDNPKTILSICKKINGNILPLTKSIRDLPLRNVLDSSISIINSMQIAAHVDYWVNGKYMRDSMQAIAGNIALFISQASECFLWMLRIAGSNHMLLKISIIKGNYLINSSLAISHFLFSTDAFCRLKHKDLEPQRKHLTIELVKNVAECILALTVLGSTFSAQSISLLAGLCIGLEFTELIYKHNNAKYI